EHLGDTRSIAVLWGRIAHIAYRQGNLDEAVELQRKRLEVNRQLGDLDGIAAASWDLARIDLARQDYPAAFPRLAGGYQTFSRWRRPDGIAAAGSTLGQLLIAAGQPGQARQVLTASRDAASKISWTEMTQQISDLLGQLPQ